MILAQLNRIRSVRPAASHIFRLSATATFAYLLALVIPASTSRPVLAPLTALLVLQASMYQTVHSVIKKVLSVTVGVTGAVLVSDFIGFSWWQLALVITGALVVGRILRLGDDLLEVPISAMLIFSSAGTHAAADGRIVDTLVGAAAGLVGGLVFVGKPRVRPASTAVGRLAGQVAGLMDEMAHDLAHDPSDGDGEADLTGIARQWLDRARALRDEIERVDDALREAAESTKLNPRKLMAPADTAHVTAVTVALRAGLEALEHAALTLRGLARSVLESSEIANEASPIRDQCTRKRLADVLAKLGEAIRTYGRLVQAGPTGDESLEEKIAAEFEEAHQRQDELAALLQPRVGDGGGPSEWPLRGEILTHVDRLRTGLSDEAVDAAARVHRTARQRRHSQARARSQSVATVRATGPQPLLRPPGQLFRRRTGSSRSHSSAHKAR